MAWGVRPEPRQGHSLLVDLGQDTCYFCERGLIMALGKASCSGRRSGLPSTGPLGEQQGGGCVWRGFRVEDALDPPLVLRAGRLLDTEIPQGLLSFPQPRPGLPAEGMQLLRWGPMIGGHRKGVLGPIPSGVELGTPCSGKRGKGG